MFPAPPKFAVVAVLFLASHLFTWLLLRFLVNRDYALRIAADVPNHRSLHQSPIPRIGGLVLIPMAVIPAGAMFADLAGVSIAALALWAISFVDDRRGLPVVVRLAAHFGTAVALLALFPALSPLQLVLWALLVVWGTNLFNFMDGADGLAGGMAVIGFSAFAVAASNKDVELAGFAVFLAAASGGFLYLNLPAARVFLGDAGSIPLGFVAAVLGLYGFQQGVWPAWFPLLVFAPFVADATITLLKRILRGEHFWRAHREHYYQRLVQMGWSHRRLVLAEYLLMLLSTLSALAMLALDKKLQLAGLATWVSLYAFAMVSIDIRWQRHQTKENKT